MVYKAQVGISKRVVTTTCVITVIKVADEKQHSATALSIDL